jgi:excisionase family DNA binding protein
VRYAWAGAFRTVLAAAAAWQGLGADAGGWRCKFICPKRLLSGLKVDRKDAVAHLDTDLLKPNDIARRFGVSRSWVYDAAKAGRIPCVRLGGSDGPLRFLPDDVEAWLELARRSWLPGESATSATKRAARAAPVRTTQLQIDALAGEP